MLQLPLHRCRSNVPNAMYNAHGLLMKQNNGSQPFQACGALQKRIIICRTLWRSHTNLL